MPAFSRPPASEGDAPRLVVQITVDQLRGDQPQLMAERFGARGFRFLRESGAEYVTAHYGHGITETAPGHATLFTGANPREHGIIGNVWFDPETGMQVYNCEDERHTILGEEKRRGTGTSPRNLISSTITDELVLASGGASRVFAVSVKDRGAILPAGHLGKAFWYSSSTGGFVTSDYYYDELPEWAADWNAAGVVDVYQGKHWELSAPKEEYVYGDQDDRECERAYAHLGRTFPHPYSAPDGSGLHKALRYTPAGDEIVASFAKMIVQREALGRGEATDFLAVSFSATDYIGHAYGPRSLEAEDNLLRLDATLGDFFQFLEDEVGLERTLIVLSADHGAPNCPEDLAEQGLEAAWVDSPRMLKNANAELKAHFATEEVLMRAHVTPYLWLDHAKIQELGLNPNEVADVAARGALKTTGLAKAVPRWRFESQSLPDSPLNRRLRAAFHAERSGDIYLVPEQMWLIGNGNAAEVLSSLHGSPWRYDTHVPILLAGPGVTNGRFARAVAPRDIAPTLAALLGIKPPSAATGTPLLEALGE